MRIIRHTPIRAALLASVLAVAGGSGAAYAALQKTTAKIGTGVVVINTNLGYENASAAGTGMVLTSTGEILTNNHVIAGATTVQVVVPGTTHTYTARVVGYDKTDDVAVLQLQNASNLKTISIGNASALRVGSRVTAIGNAGGTGTLTSAKGTVTGLGRTITASDENGSSEQLEGLIETNADLQPGDSGGPLESSAGRAVGMDTAAAAASPFAAYAASDAYAIPIGKALPIAKQIVAGRSSATVHIGGTAFLGIDVANDPLAATSGAAIVGVVSGGPAASAGLVPGDVITAVGGQTVAGASDVASILQTYKPGVQVGMTYTDTTGASQTATVTLGSGPPQ